MERNEIPVDSDTGTAPSQAPPLENDAWRLDWIGPPPVDEPVIVHNVARPPLPARSFGLDSLLLLMTLTSVALAIVSWIKWFALLLLPMMALAGVRTWWHVQCRKRLGRPTRPADKIDAFLESLLCVTWTILLAGVSLFCFPVGPLVGIAAATWYLYRTWPSEGVLGAAPLALGGWRRLVPRSSFVRPTSAAAARWRNADAKNDADADEPTSRMEWSESPFSEP